MHMAHKTAAASLIHYEKNTFKASVCQKKIGCAADGERERGNHTAGLLLVACHMAYPGGPAQVGLPN